MERKRYATGKSPEAVGRLRAEKAGLRKNAASYPAIENDRPVEEPKSGKRTRAASTDYY